MKSKVLSFLIASGLLALAAWLVHTPNPVQADAVPEKYRETVRKGLEYLVKNQFKDGHWEGDDGKHPVAMTGLVGLALLMTSRDTDNKYWPSVRKAMDWLIDQSQAGREGLIYSGHPSETPRYMEGHGLAMLFLAGAWKSEDGTRREKVH